MLCWVIDVAAVVGVPSPQEMMIVFAEKSFRGDAGLESVKVATIGKALFVTLSATPATPGMLGADRSEGASLMVAVVVKAKVAPSLWTTVTPILKLPSSL